MAELNSSLAPFSHVTLGFGQPVILQANVAFLFSTAEAFLRGCMISGA